MTSTTPNRHLIRPPDDAVRVAPGLYETGTLSASQPGLYAITTEHTGVAPKEGTSA